MTSFSYDNRPPLETETAAMVIHVQTDSGMGEMTELLNIKDKSQNPDAVLTELFINKVKITNCDKIYRPVNKAHARWIIW